MKLHLISRGLWTVLAVYPDEERCDVLELADQLERDDPASMRAYSACSPGCRRPAHRATCVSHAHLGMASLN